MNQDGKIQEAKKSEIKIQVISDTHFESLRAEPNWEIEFPIVGDVLILAGDIGSPHSDGYWKFIQYCSKNCKLVLIVPGNHEFFGSTVEEIEQVMEAKAKLFNNVTIFQRKYVVLNNEYVILGATLWSFIPSHLEKQMTEFAADFRPGGIKNCTPQKFNEWFNRDKKWIEEGIKFFTERKMKIIIATHYLPIFNLCEPKYVNSWTQHAFSTDLSYLFPYISYWCYGHVHYNPTDSNILTLIAFPKLKFVFNQKGYPFNVPKKGYNKKFFFTIPN